MRRHAVTITCLVTLWACENAQVPAPSPGLRAQALTAEPALVPEIEQPVRSVALDDTHALFAYGTQGVQLLDVSDPKQPKARPAFEHRPFSTDGFYRVGDRVLLLAHGMTIYTGERDDLELPTNTDAILVLDIRDPTRPAVIEEVAVDGIIGRPVARRRGNTTTLFLVEDIGEESHLLRYELSEGRLAQNADLPLPGRAGSTAASSDWLAVSVTKLWEPQSTVLAFDISGSGFTASYSATFDAAGLQISIDKDRLQIFHATPAREEAPTGDPAGTVDTIVLRTGSPAQPTGSCDLNAWPEWHPFRDAPLVLPDASTVVISTAGQLQRTTLDASGNCLERSVLSPRGSRHALLATAPDRLLALGSYQLNLYDTARGADGAPLGSVPLYTPFTSSDLTQPIQLVPLPTPIAAEDGTPEPQLAALLYNGPHPIGRFQLATMSDHTLTARARIDDPDPPRSFGVVGSSFFTVSATRLRTFELAALDVPQQLGELLLKDNFTPAYQFGAYPAGFMFSEWSSNWMIDSADLPAGNLQIRSPDGKTTIATLAVDRSYSLDGMSSTAVERVGDLLVRFDSAVTNWDEQEAQVHFIVYDLRDPTRPREGAHLTSSAIRGTFIGSSRWPAVRYTYEIIGNAFVFTQLETPFGFQVVDFREPSRPLIYPRLELSGTNLKPHSTFRSGNKIYALQTVSSTVYGTAVDFADPRAPLVGTRRALPGYLVGETKDALYTYSLRPNTTLSKIVWGRDSATVLAANKLPKDRVPKQILDDEQGHLFVLHERDPYAPYSSEPRASWIGLDIFHARTLEKLGSLEVDAYTSPMQLVAGSLLIPVSGTTLRVDMTDAHNPRIVPASQP